MKRTLFYLLGCFMICAKANSQRLLLIRNVNIVDVENGRLIKNQDILIKDSLIIRIEKTGKQLKADTVIEANNRYLVPGFWDMHTHIWNDASSFPLLIANGVTGVRGMFETMSNVKRWREKMRKGEIDGPMFYAAGPIVDGPKPIWPGSVAVKNEDDGRKAVDSLKNKLGVDFIKVYSLLSRSSFFAIADECRKQGISFAGHVPNEVSILEAARAGQKSMEHLYGFIELAGDSSDYFMNYQLGKLKDSSFAKRSNRKDFLFRTYNENKLRSITKELKTTGTWVCPTLTVNRGIAYITDTTLLHDPRMVYMGSFMKNFWDYRQDFRFKTWTEKDFMQSRQEFELKLKITRLLHEAGVPLLAGTDFPNPHCYIGFGLHDELEWMVKAGLSPAEALKTATINPARFFGIEKTDGSIAVNKRANLVLLENNPLQNISNSKSIEAVFVNGKFFSKEKLRELLERVKKMMASTGSGISSMAYYPD